MTITRNGDYIEAGIRTYYEVRGSGDPVVLLHGGLCTAETFDAQAAALAEHYRVWVPERRGHGRTPDVEGPLSYQVMADDTIAFLDKIDTGPVHLVGFSDGASVALLVALRRPDLVTKLVLIGQPISFDGTRPEMQAMLDSFTPDFLPPMLRQLYDAVSPDGPEHFDAVFTRVIAGWRDTGATLEDLARIEQPTLILAGQNDIPTPEHLLAAQRALPAGQLGIVPGASHALPFEKPDIVNRLLLDFLS
jgi:pimeloyl-ACP methyl ester carboxylesterase